MEKLSGKTLRAVIFSFQKLNFFYGWRTLFVFLSVKQEAFLVDQIIRCNRQTYSDGGILSMLSFQNHSRTIEIHVHSKKQIIRNPHIHSIYKRRMICEVRTRQFQWINGSFLFSIHLIYIDECIFIESIWLSIKTRLRFQFDNGCLRDGFNILIHIDCSNDHITIF